MEEILVRKERVVHGRNRSMENRLYAEPSSYTGTQKVPAELAICKNIGRLLEISYPGHPWAVRVDIQQGLAMIGIPDLLGNWTFNIHLDKIDEKIVKDAGGHILERFKIPRGAIDVAAYLTAFAKYPMIGRYGTRHGNLIPT